jgi:FkbM family methyltransferase
MSITLALKTLIVGTRLEPFAKWARWHADRYRHPELAEFFFEESLLPRVLKRLLRLDSNVVDVGAHFGSFVSLARETAPKGSHIAVEASPIKAQALRQRFPQLEVHAVAAGDHEGLVTFCEDSHRSGFSHVARLPAEAGSQVEMKTLDLLLTDRRVDLLKIDVEGFELSALKGARKTIDNQHPAIIFECGPQGAIFEPGSDRDTLFQHIQSELSYEVFCFSDFLFGKGSLSADEFRPCGLYPFRSINFIAMPRG